MNLHSVILAFLAARSPAAYQAETIATRVSRCGLLDAAPTTDAVLAALADLASERMDTAVRADVDPLTQRPIYYATEAGIRKWGTSGRVSVG